MKRIDTGGLSFSRLINGGYYFVDKSMLIADVLDADPEGVYLYTRPRRFGKSTNVSMLDAFFNMKYEGNTWFDDLEISGHHEYDQYRNAFPVIRLDLKDVVPSGGDFGSFVNKVRDVIRSAYLEFGYLLESDRLLEQEKSDIRATMARETPADSVWRSVLDLCSMLERHHDRKVVVLMDEYDRVITNTFGSELQGRIIESLGELMSATLKGNQSLQMGYVTGVMQVTKDGMFSGLNNLRVNNVFSKRSDERFGFTEAEVRQLLEYYGEPERFDEVRDWYDGYRFGDAEVYNPFSIMSYVSEGFEPMNYWANTSSVTPLRWMLERVDTDSIGTVANIVSGGQAVRDVHAEMTYDDLSRLRDRDLHSLMVLTGYLKAVPHGDGMYGLSIPNREVMSTVDEIIRDLEPVSGKALRMFADSVTSGDAEAIATALQDVLSDASYFNLGDESSYALVVLTLLYGILPDYEERSEIESGNGRSDLVLTPRRGGAPAIIIELKVSSSESELERDADAAMAQIHDRRYYLGMHGDVVLAGISFWGKVPSVRTEVLRIRPVDDGPAWSRGVADGGGRTAPRREGRRTSIRLDALSCVQAVIGTLKSFFI